MEAALFFLYGLAAGLLLTRFRGRRALASPPRGFLAALAWLTMAASFALAALLIGWAAWTAL